MQLNLSSYNGRDLQNMLALLIQFEAQGGMDIRFLREQIHNYVFSELRKAKSNTWSYKEKRKQKHVKMLLCPSCGRGRLEPTPNYEGLNIVSCKKCRYSMILEEEIENG